MRTQFAYGKTLQWTLILLLAAVIALVLVMAFMALTQDTPLFEVARLNMEDTSYLPRLFSPWAVDANKFLS